MVNTGFSNLSNKPLLDGKVNNVYDAPLEGQNEQVIVN